MTLTPGARLWPYEVQAAIGAGGMGEVFRARDTRLDRSVAIKVLPARVSADPDRRARFAREAKAIAGLSHPHICTLHDVGEHEGEATLASFSQEYAETMAYQIAEVLAFRSEIDRAFEWLDRAFALRDGGMADIKNDLLLRSVEADPRHAALLRRLRLPVW